MQASQEPPDFTRLDDTALLAERAVMRERLANLPPHSPDHAALTLVYDASTAEVNKRARAAWTRSS
jgi:hypothetical protein